GPRAFASLAIARLPLLLSRRARALPAARGPMRPEASPSIPARASGFHDRRRLFPQSCRGAIQPPAKEADMALHPIRFGIQTGQQNVAWQEMLDLWQKADAWGYDSLWNFDHFFPIFVDPQGPCFEGWTTLAALGQATKRARIGQLVNG